MTYVSINKFEVLKAHAKLFYNIYYKAYLANELEYENGYFLPKTDDCLNKIKWAINRPNYDTWIIKNRFEAIIVFNAYRIGMDESIKEYPFQVVFDDVLIEKDGKITAQNIFTYKVYKLSN